MDEAIWRGHPSRNSLPRNHRPAYQFMKDNDVSGALMEWRNLCRDKEANRGIFAHDKDEGLRYMENR
eukprot:8088438-Karenia_brevis.AAC.1